MPKKLYIIKKTALRLLVATVVLVCIKVLIDSDYSNNFFTSTTIFYFLSGLIFFLISWGLSDWLIKQHLKKSQFEGLDWLSGLWIVGKTLVVVLSLVALGYYLALFHFADFLEIQTADPWLEFRTDFSRALVISVTIILSNLFYFADKVKNNLHTRMVELEKEILASNYKSLKDQISPHFLFNSLNTLTSLMYEDRDLASDFTARLASCYRYILDNRDKDLINLDKELTFLDSYIFMMDVRHKNSLKIRTKMNLDPNEYVIPTLCLQMVVENALKHNYFSNERPLSVIISNDDLYINVSNTLRKRIDSQTSTQLGLDNIKKRFSFYTNTPVNINQKNGLFTISLPLLKKNIEQVLPLTFIS